VLEPHDRAEGVGLALRVFAPICAYYATIRAWCYLFSAYGARRLFSRVIFVLVEVNFFDDNGLSISDIQA
jgi:hypothetical protein